MRDHDPFDPPESDRLSEHRFTAFTEHMLLSFISLRYEGSFDDVDKIGQSGSGKNIINGISEMADRKSPALSGHGFLPGHDQSEAGGRNILDLAEINDQISDPVE